MRNIRQPGAARLVRCAIYTRKSTEEGLEQDFNSLDAQREACAAYILSQRHEGWVPFPDYYDDGGYSGGTMERPALKALLAEIAAGRIDVIVVYKVDRLTRSLSDFAKIVDVLDAAEASFVSVTQSFNTTTSMGRLTLNVLLSFAQFEREVTGERIRDKIAASKAKGMWMGGPVPLGYDLAERKLVENAAEAKTVRHIFSRYLELGSGRLLQVELEGQGVRSKPRTNRHGKLYGAQPISRGALYAILQNRLYIGEVVHKGQSYAGQHPAIINPAIFEEVRQRIAQGRVERRHGTNATDPSLLAGLMTDTHGRRMSPSHAVKQAKRYRYYTSQNDGASAALPAWRISAAEIEALVCRQVAAAIREHVRQRTSTADMDASAIVTLQTSSAALIGTLNDATGAALRSTLLELVRGIVLHQDRIDIGIDPAGIDPVLAANTPIVATAAIENVRIGKRIKLVIPGAPASHQRPRNPALVKLVVQAFAARNRITVDPDPKDAADQELSRAYEIGLARLSYFSPDIITAILDGRQPPTLTRETLIRATKLPLAWNEQRAMFGFS